MRYFQKSQVLLYTYLSLLIYMLATVSLFLYIKKNHPTSHLSTLLNIGHSSLQFVSIINNTFPNQPNISDHLLRLKHLTKPLSSIIMDELYVDAT